MALMFRDQPFSPSKLPEFPKIKGVEQPVVFRLWKTRIRWNKLNKRNDIPSAFVIDPFYSHQEGKESGYLRYYENSRPGTQAGKQIVLYEPDGFQFDTLGEFRVYPGQYEKLFWWMNHPELAGNTKDGVTPEFYREDKQKEAKVKSNLSTLKAKALNLIYNDESGLSDNELTELATTLKVGNVGMLTIDEIKLELEKVAIQKPEQFIAVCESALMKIKAVIFNAVQKKIIVFDEEDKAWWKLDHEGGKVQKILTIKAEHNPTEKLIEWMGEFDTEDTFKYITERLAGRGKKVKEVIDTEEHDSTGNFACDQCDFIATSLTGLRSHERHKHAVKENDQSGTPEGEPATQAASS